MDRIPPQHPLRVTRQRIAILAACLLLASCSMLDSDPLSDRAWTAQILDARQTLTQLGTEQHLPILEVTVAKDGDIIWNESLNLAYPPIRDTPGSSNQYRIGSLSKLFTAAVAAKLAEQGKLDLDKSVRDYLPSLPDAYQAVTPRMLLGHLSGVRNYGRDDYLNTTRYLSVQEGLSKFIGQPLIDTPGAHYHYSSYGYNLLGAVIERACGAPYLRCVAELLLDPLDLIAVHPDSLGVYIKRVNDYQYSDDGKSVVPAPEMDLSDRWPSGGFVSTAYDLALFADAVALGDYLKPAMHEAMFTPQHEADGKATIVGFGWRIGTDPKGRRIYYHGGDTVGGRAMLMVWPDQRLVVTVVTDVSFARIAEKEIESLAEPFLSPAP